jgi:Alpha-galactosidase
MILGKDNAAVKDHVFKFENEAPSILTQIDNNIFLSQLFGLSCGVCGNDEGPARARGLSLLKTSMSRFESEDLILLESIFEKNRFKITWGTADGSIQIESRWEFCYKTGVFSRKETLKNTSDKNITIFSYLARFPFSAGNYEIYSQGSRWCNENQGVWQTLHHGSIVLGCEGGRTSQGSTPYMCLREIGQKFGVAFHLIPCGNWSIRISAHNSSHNSTGASLPFAVVEMGLDNGDLNLELASNCSIELPEILFHALPGGEPHLGASRLHRYLLDNSLCRMNAAAPVTYNTWFDTFDFLDMDRLRNQLACAKEIGCDVFTVDAGWFGGETGNWYEQAGDWREKNDAAFRGHMIDFAEEVRFTGLGFGLWMEPERISKSVQIFKDHPDWFIPIYNGFNYPDLSRPEVYSYISGEISRLIEKYGLVWLKIDFNSELGVDTSGTELYSYYDAWYRLMNELMGKYPQVFFENCASGGMK